MNDADATVSSETDNKPTILIVDDEPANLRVIGLLMENDYVVRVARSGKEALRYCRHLLNRILFCSIS